MASRTAILIGTSADGALCVDAPGDGTLTLVDSCCPYGFTAMGATGGNVVSCLEDVPAAGRAVVFVTVLPDGTHCYEQATPQDCCPIGFDFIGWGGWIVATTEYLCLERL